MQWLRESRQTPESNYAIVFCSPECCDMAKEMVAERPDHLRLGDITWAKFEDGFPNIFIHNIEAIRGRDVVFVLSLLNHSELLSQLSVLVVLPRSLIKSLTVILSYFPTGTMERVDEEGQIATAATLAKLISATPLTASGPSKLFIYDIHALQNRFYFEDSVIPLPVSAVPLFLDKLHTDHKNEKVAICFPDDGSAKRFGRMFKDFPNIICAKVRQDDKRVVTIKDGKEYAPGTHIFIIDDLVKTGGTLLECKQALFNAGASKVSAYVTHVVFPSDSWKRFTPEKDPRPFSVFYGTDSCPEMAKTIKDVQPFHIMKLAPLIVEDLLKY